MNASNSKRSQPLHSGFVYAGTVARMRRGGQSVRAGRRSALLSMMSTAYANSQRGTLAGEPRTGGDRT